MRRKLDYSIISKSLLHPLKHPEDINFNRNKKRRSLLYWENDTSKRPIVGVMLPIVRNDVSLYTINSSQ